MNKQWLYVIFSNSKENKKFQEKLISLGWSWNGTDVMKNFDRPLLLKRFGLNNNNEIHYKRLRISDIEYVINTFTPIVIYGVDNEIIDEFINYEIPYYQNNILFNVDIDFNVFKQHNLSKNPIDKIGFKYFLNKVNDKINKFHNRPKPDWIWYH